MLAETGAGGSVGLVLQSPIMYVYQDRIYLEKKKTAKPQ